MQVVLNVKGSFRTIGSGHNREWLPYCKEWKICSHQYLTSGKFAPKVYSWCTLFLSVAIETEVTLNFIECTHGELILCDIT